MYKLDLPCDTKEVAAIERRRECENQRKERIFNARTRQIGVDTQALQKQIQEKNQRDQAEKERNSAYDGEMIKNAQICTLLDQRQRNDTKKLNEDLNKFRLDQQTAPSRREFDLNDPLSKKKDQPARVADDDPRCQLSGLQIFGGEDLSAKDRKKLQQEQMREWCKQQQQEKQRHKEDEEFADKLCQKTLLETDARAAQLQCEEEECRRKLNLATMEYNQALCRERKAKEAIDKQKELDDNHTELVNHIYGDVLTENPGVASSSFGSHRVIPANWKGMSEQQLADIHRAQQEQEAEKQRMIEEEAELQRAYEDAEKRQTRIALLQESEQERKLKEREKLIAEENLRMAREQRASRQNLDKVVYTNPPTDNYFAQFNTGTR